MFNSPQALFYHGAMSQKFELRARKHLGQHFLHNQAVIGQLLHAIAGRPGQQILEIGPGLGALTLPLLAQVKAMVAIDLDTRVMEILAAKAAPVGTLDLRHGDFLQLTLNELGPGPWRLVGNLPYNLSSSILVHCVAQRAHIADMHFMLQLEVVRRLVAAPGSKDYGRLSLLVQRYFYCEELFTVGPENFTPPPRVQSAVVRLTREAASRWAVRDEGCWDLILRRAFGQRRKMLRASLAGLLDSEELAAQAVAPTARPEQLSGADFARLANALAAKNLED